MEWREYHWPYSVSDEGHVYNRERDSYLLPIWDNTHYGPTYAFRFEAGKPAQRRGVKRMMKEAWGVKERYSKNWTERMRHQIKQMNKELGVGNPKGRQPAQPLVPCCICGRQIRQERGVVWPMCKRCSRPKDHNAPVKELELHDPYPGFHVPGAYDNDILVMGF